VLALPIRTRRSWIAASAPSNDIPRHGGDMDRNQIFAIVERESLQKSKDAAIQMIYQEVDSKVLSELIGNEGKKT
jgi:hypothetical protein